MKAQQYEQIKKHGEDLNKIFNTGIEPVKLCKRLHRLEAKAHQLTTDYCNGAIEGDEYEKQADKILNNLDKILDYKQQNIPCFLNGDPRGYALKIRTDYSKSLYLHKDWGGYGIICPEIS
jgi:hypothetical protein